MHWRQLLRPLMGGTRRSVDSAYLLPVHRESGPRDNRPHIHEPGDASGVRPAQLHGRTLPCGNSRPISPPCHWSGQSTTLDKQSSHKYFRVSHPFHPLFGREFQLADWRHNWTEDRVYFRGPDERLTSIPSHWTDLLPEDPLVVMAAGRSHFRADDLVELVRLIKRLEP